MSNKRASEDQLDELHGIVAKTLVDEIQRLKNTEEGVPASLLSQAAKFLKDNGVDRAIRPGDPLDLLNDELPLLDENGHG